MHATNLLLIKLDIKVTGFSHAEKSKDDNETVRYSSQKLIVRSMINISLYIFSYHHGSDQDIRADQIALSWFLLIGC